MKTQNPWMGRARGSAGNMTSSKVYDKNVMRAKAFEVNNPKTAAQTAERNFFAECQSMTSQITEEQLRSLFSIKPKSKSRRNELLSQLLKAYQIVNGIKDFKAEELKAIGNGAKVNTPFLEELDYDSELGINYSKEMFGSNATDDSKVYLVAYDNTENLKVLETNVSIVDLVAEATIESIVETGNLNAFYGYFTIAEDGSSESRPFGTFALKTRAY